MRQAILLVLMAVFLAGCASSRSERISDAAFISAASAPNYDIGNSAYSGSVEGSLIFFGGWCLGELVGSMLEDKEEPPASSSREKGIYEILEDIKKRESSHE